MMPRPVPPAFAEHDKEQERELERNLERRSLAKRICIMALYFSTLEDMKKHEAFARQCVSLADTLIRVLDEEEEK